MVIHDSTLFYLRSVAPDTSRRAPPLLWPVGALAGGILIDATAPVPTLPVVMLLGIGTLSALLTKSATVARAGLALSACAAGALCHDASLRHAPSHDVRHVWPTAAHAVTLEGRVVDVRPHGVTADGLPWRPQRQGHSILLDLERGWAIEGIRQLSGRVRIHTRGGAPPAPGTCIRVRGHAIERPSRSADGRVVGQLSCVGPPALMVLHDHDHGPITRWRWTARERAGRAVACGLPGNVADLQQAILLGRRGLMNEDQIRPFRVTGLAHVLALSGMHVGLIAGALWMVARGLRLRRRLAASAIVVILLSYGAMIEAQPSATRALILVIIASTGMVGRRVPDSLNSLCAAALIILAIQPHDLFRPGFQLSFVITGGIVLGLPHVTARVTSRSGSVRPAPLQAVLHRARAMVTSSLYVSGLAWLAGAPLIATHFGTVHPYGAVLAVIFVPVIAIALIAGFFKLAVGMVSTHAAAGLCAPVELATRAAIRLVEWLEQLPGCAISVAAPSWPWITAYYATLLILLCPPRIGRRMLLCSALAALSVLQCKQWCDSTVSIHALPAGGVVIHAAGTITAVDIGDGHTGKSAAVALRQFLLDYGYHQPRRFIATTGESCRFNAMYHLLESGSETWLSKHLLTRRRPGTALTHLFEHCETLDVRPRSAVAGTQLPIRGIDARFVWPRMDMPPGSSTADRALIALLHGPRHTVLLAGAMTPYVVQKITDSGIEADTLILTRPDAEMALDSLFLQTLGLRTVIFNAASPGAMDELVRTWPTVQFVNSAETGYACALR